MNDKNTIVSDFVKYGRRLKRKEPSLREVAKNKRANEIRNRIEEHQEMLRARDEVLLDYSL
jgi:hypothetical protein